MMELLAAGASHEEILADYPFLESADIQAALLYVAKLADHILLSYLACSGVRFLVDNQLPTALARWLAARGADTVHVLDTGLGRF